MIQMDQDRFLHIVISFIDVRARVRFFRARARIYIKIKVFVLCIMEIFVVSNVAIISIVAVSFIALFQILKIDRKNKEN
nr:MAG TPA: hypothetical protein [Microviridae sp.]